MKFENRKRDIPPSVIFKSPHLDISEGAHPYNNRHILRKTTTLKDQQDDEEEMLSASDWNLTSK